MDTSYQRTKDRWCCYSKGWGKMEEDTTWWELAADIAAIKLGILNILAVDLEAPEAESKCWGHWKKGHLLKWRVPAVSIY